MIIIYFLYFIVSILIFSAAPSTPGGIFTTGQNILAILVLLFVFQHYNRARFSRLRSRLNHATITPDQARKEYQTHINIHFILAVVLFAVEIFAFDLKFFCLKLSTFGLYEFMGNLLGLTVLILHLAMIWYWGFRTMGDILELDESAEKYIRSNIKFNLVIVIPWLSFSLLKDLLGLILPDIDAIINAPGIQEIVFGLFLLLLILLAPIFITRLWDCTPLPPSPLRERITDFCRSQGVQFKGIMSWNALGKSLVTAAVVGVAARFRYLLLTPSLLEILDEDEIMAVVSHEVGHAKKKHPVLYVVFFMGGIFILSNYLMEWINDFFFTTSMGLKIVTGSGGADSGQLQLLILPLFILVFVLYFRYIFAYFMRNFERQADIYCFESGIDPNHMISSFLTLKTRLGDDGKKNWHHYTLSQRIDFLRKGIEDPGVVTRHNKKVKRAVIAFVTLLLVSITLFHTIYNGQSGMKRAAAYYEHQLEKNPDQPELYSVLAEIYLRLKKWEKSKKAYEYAVGLNPEQPGMLNNFAWLLLTSEDESLRDPERALKLVMKSVQMGENNANMDTLAEAYYQNGMYMEAYRAAKRALQLATEDRPYYERQLKKMKKALKEKNKSASLYLSSIFLMA